VYPKQVRHARILSFKRRVQKGSELAKVLLVEDDSAIAQLYAFKLRLDGHSVRVAAGSADAADRFSEERPDVVCLDVRLPDGSGGELADSLA
jgi:DNA-binding response OmpR family regulator